MEAERTAHVLGTLLAWMSESAASPISREDALTLLKQLRGEPLELAQRTDFTRARELTPEVEASIDDAFEYHAWDTAQTAAGREIRVALADAVKAIVANAPPCPDRDAAIRKLREARMDANSAITHRGRL